ncbi:MAG TPA: alpha-hydroxy acid oxidase [Steroidobacteraceae bacterium]|jgi:(S)-2-hydroxy-acid oxidase
MLKDKRAALTRRTFVGGLTAASALWSQAHAEDPPPSQLFARAPAPLTQASQVPDVMGFEPLARTALPPAHWGYLATGIDGDLTMARNADAFLHYQIRARRFADLSHLDTSRMVLGTRWASPIYLSAVSSQRAFHPEGEVAVARAARSRGMQMMLSTGSSLPVEAVTEARGAALWQQLYATDDFAVTAAIVQRAEKAGATAIVLTVDAKELNTRRNNETLGRAMLADSRSCVACHANNSHDMWHARAMFQGLDTSRVTSLSPPALTTAFLDRLRQLVKGRLMVKGIVTGEDAAIAVAHGADGIVVSNHGGRNEETLRASIDCVPEVVAAVKARVPVFVDGGIRRGTDVFKALALGATAVGIGRPQAWGLAAFGQPGVERVIDIYNAELAAIMRQAGTPTIADITAAAVLRA